VHDGIHDLRKLAPGVGQRVEIMLPRTPGLDQPAMPQQGEMVAHRRLALCAQIGTKFRDISLFFAQEHEHLKASRIRDLLQ
jgi:hypothetical protein